jgi:hypothetical protein
MEDHDICMFQVFEERGFPDGREGGSFLLLKTDLLQSHHLVREAGKGKKYIINYPNIERTSPN